MRGWGCIGLGVRGRRRSRGVVVVGGEWGDEGIGDEGDSRNGQEMRR